MGGQDGIPDPAGDARSGRRAVVRAAPRRLRAALVWALALAAPVLFAQPLAATTAAPDAALASQSRARIARYDGEIELQVDATDLAHRVLRVRETLPVRPGALGLYFPRWLPGTHGPFGDINRLAGLQIRAGGERVPWQRDVVDMYLIHVQVPPGATRLELAFESLTPLAENDGRVVMTPEMLNLQWNDVVLYPAGYAASGISVRPSLRLPAQWQWAGALREARRQGEQIEFGAVTLEHLVDAPLYAGRYVRRIELDAGGAARPVALDLVADRPELLQPSEAQIAAHRELVRQADLLFASRHFRHYDFMLSLSESLSGNGLEHHESSENGVKTDYWERWSERAGARGLLPHEYVHSWNGKFRRPRDLATPDFNTPMGASLLWVYEGQTQFWGWVLAARSGLVSAEQSRDQLAWLAAAYEHRSGRAWRDLQDTVHEGAMSRGRGKEWRDWQRTASDYYGESLLIWLDVDTLMRAKSGERRSLDDFARAFFGVRDGELGPLTYDFDELVRTLRAVQDEDWAGLLQRRLASHDGAPLDGLARSGWRLVYGEKQSDALKAIEADDKANYFTYSVGLTLAPDGKLRDVQWDGPAFRAGLAPGMTLVAVQQQAYKPEVLARAIGANRDGSAPLELLVRDGDFYRTVRIDYRAGLRYPRLERIEGTPDRLQALLAPR